MSAPTKRRVRPPHDWSHEPPRLSRWYYLRQVLGEVELIEGDGPITGYSRSCDRCGLVQVFARMHDAAAGADREVTFTGFDWDSLTPLRTPPCDVLVRPGATEAELVGLVDVRQLALPLSGAA